MDQITKLSNGSYQIGTSGPTFVSQADAQQTLDSRNKLSAPAVVTAQPAQDHLAQVNNDVTNWSNQIQQQQRGMQQPSITQTGQGYQIRGTGQTYGSYAEAVGALNGQVNPSTKNPNQSVIDKIGAVAGDQGKTVSQAEWNQITSNAGVPFNDLTGVTKNPDGTYTIPTSMFSKFKLSAPTGGDTGDYTSYGNDQLSQINATLDKTYTDYKNTLDQFNNGIFPLSPEEQSQINALKAQFDQQISSQTTANANYNGAITNVGIAAGRNRYASEVEAGNIKTAVDSGLKKVQDIEIQAAGAIASLKQALLDKDYARIKDLYSTTTDLLKEKASVVQDTITNTRNAIKDAADAQAAALKAATDQATALAGEISVQLTGDPTADAQLFMDYAQRNSADQTPEGIQRYAASLLAAQQEYSTKQGEATQDAAQAGWSAGAKEWANVLASQGIDTAGKSITQLGAEAKKLGLQGLNDYMTADANRKATKVSVNAGGFNQKTALFDMNKSLAATVAANQKAGAKDRFISPGQYNSALLEWEAAGGDPTVFNTQFKGYRNPDNSDYGV